MQATTLTVPAEYVETFRINVYSQLMGEGDALEVDSTPLAFPDGCAQHREAIAGDPEKVARYSVRVIGDTLRIAELAEVMAQLGWTDHPVHGVKDGPATIKADPKVIAGIIGGCLVDVGAKVHEITDAAPFDREAFDATIASAVWLADRQGEVAV